MRHGFFQKIFLLCAACLGVQMACGVRAQTVSDSARSEIRTLIHEKRNRSPVERKLDTQLVYALREHRGKPVVPGVPHVRPDVTIRPDGKVLIDLEGDITGLLLRDVRSLGARIKSSHPRYDAARMLVPIANLERIAALPAVRSIRAADRAETRVGSVDSEGDVTHGANIGRSDFSIDGTGIMIGVLSDSVDFLSNSQTSGDLPTVTVLPGQSGVPGSGEGTAMLEIVHDLAPGSELFFASAFNGVASFAQNIQDLRTAGCDIIVDDVGYFNESPFQDAPIADAVNIVTADGALYFSSAGNAGNKNDNTSSTWEGDFVDGGPAGSPINSGTIHSFGATTYNQVLAGGSSRRVDLFWSDPLGASANDYDLFVLSSSGASVLRSSTNPQTGSQDPYESVNTLNVGERIVIVKDSGFDRFLHLSAGRGRLSVSTAGEIAGHSAAVGAYSVAAVNAGTSYPGKFQGGASNPVETFSSDGPRRIFYEADGTPTTPGDFLSTGGTVRDKPDITAADGVRTSIGDFDPFFGTSAAAPHAAAIAALLLSYNPDLTPAAIRTIFQQSALDIEAAGPDRDSGIGLMMADAALQVAPPQLFEPKIVPDGFLLVSENCSAANSLPDPGEIVTIDFSLQNVGDRDTTNLFATLQPSPGIIPLSGGRSYGALQTNGIPASRPFTFAVDGSCGDEIDAVLSLIDGTNNFGLITNTLELGFTPTTLSAESNTAKINIPGSGPSGPGSPYPSSLTVSGVSGQVVAVTVTFNQLSHKFPDDLDILLVGPTGVEVMLMSDAGGGSDIVDVDLTFDDAGPLLPDASQIISGTYRPTDLDSGESLPSPAPAAPYGVSLQALSGLDPNGAWSLYAADDAVPDKGNMDGGWTLTLVTESESICCTSSSASDLAVSKFAFPSTPVPGDIVSYVIAVTNAGPDDAIDVAIEDPLPAGLLFVSVATGQGSCTNLSGVVSCEIGALSAGASATATVQVQADDAGLYTNTAYVIGGESDPVPANNVAGATTTVLVPPVISTVQDQVTLEDIATGLIPFSIFDAETAPSNLSLQATSTNPILIPTNAMVFGGSGTNRTLTITPADDHSGLSDIGIVVTDEDNATSVTTFMVTVLPVNDAPTLDPISILAVFAGSGIHTVQVSGIGAGPSDEAQALVVGAISDSPSILTNISVNYVSPDSSGTVLFEVAGPVVGDATLTVTVQDDGGTTNGGMDEVSREFVVTVLPVADLSGIVSAHPQPVLQSNQLTFTIVITNHGPNSAEAVRLTNSLPMGVALILAESSQGGCSNLGALVTCDLGILAFGAVATSTLSVVVNDDVSISNVVEISSLTMDPAPSNNNVAIVVQVIADNDGDLMPDEYEMANQLNPLDPADAWLDPDGDGLITIEEFFAGTDPNDPSDVLSISGISSTPVGIEIVFQSVSGMEYQVEQSGNLFTNIWLSVGGALSGTGSVGTLLDTNSPAPGRAYRVRLQ